MAEKGKKKKRLISWQLPMIRVLYALIPITLASIYFFGWRSLLVLIVTNAVGFITEYLFVRKYNEPVTSAVFVSGSLLALSLPPTIPFWMAAVGIIFGITFGKMVFGGFGRNIFNPALTGRAFLYVSFGMQMTNKWVNPVRGALGGFLHYQSLDAVTTATPLALLKKGQAIPVLSAFLGNIPGSLGETCALLAILGGLYLIWRKAANYKIVVPGIVGMLAMQTILWLSKVPGAGNPIAAMVCGGFMFGIFFFATDPISATKTSPGQWIYGTFIGIVSVVIRVYTAWPEGIMFAILLANMFGPITDFYVTEYKKKRKARKAAKA